MEDISLHILDIAENSIRAQATLISIEIIEEMKEDILKVRITDNGKGMDSEELNMAKDPFYTTKGKKTGMGISLLAQSAQEAGGDLTVSSKPGKGTAIEASFQTSNIDTKPLGDIGKTLRTLIASNPESDFIFSHTRNGKSFRLDTRNMKTGSDKSTSDVLSFLRESLKGYENFLS